jgi:thioredoxin-dependent peroxiredoxin
MIEEGKPAPDFELTSDSGEKVKLSSLRGKPVVLYFYPKSGTPGCTRQACGIRDVYSEFEAKGAVVLGVSSDKEDAQAKFRSDYELPFAVLADPDHEAGKAFGVEKPDSPYFERSTFVIGADGNVAKVLRNVKPDDHAERVLAALDDAA